MLCLQVCSPGHLILKPVIFFFQDFNSFGVSDLCKLRRHYIVQPVQKTFVHKGIKEIHFFRRMLKHIADHIFQHGLCQHHIVLQIRKSHLRLDHPELCRMSGRVRILCTEGRPEGINIAKSLCICFCIQLTADRQAGLFSEKVLAVIHRSFFRLRNIFHVQCSNPEHLAGPFTVTSGDQRCVHIHKPSVLEKFVKRISGQRPDAEHCLEGIGSGPQMRDRAEKFKAVALFLQRIIRR